MTEAKIIHVEKCDLCLKLARKSHTSVFVLPFTNRVRLCRKCVDAYFQDSQQIRKYSR